MTRYAFLRFAGQARTLMGIDQLLVEILDETDLEYTLVVSDLKVNSVEFWRASTNMTHLRMRIFAGPSDITDPMWTTHGIRYIKNLDNRSKEVL